eukprot:GHVU01103453.1.p1 GENE.GHVU01103453.1~~GHVU01103453.1.p1  ORF type:complete len:119 (+),score=1.59 GHVU01103453.1:817-1173(+)
MSASEQLHPSTQRTPSLFPSARTHGLQSLPPYSRIYTQPPAATHGDMQVTPCYAGACQQSTFPSGTLAAVSQPQISLPSPPLIETTLSRGYGMVWLHVHHPTERFRIMCPTEVSLQLR